MLKMIADGLKDFFGRFNMDEREAEYRYLSQAIDHVHLEYLMRTWDRQRRNRGNW